MAATTELLSFGKQGILWWALWPRTVYPLQYHPHWLFHSSITCHAVLEFPLPLVWPFAFSLLLGISLVKCLHRLPGSLPDCSIVYPRRVLPER